MSKSKPDRRVERTQNSLRAAFVDLMLSEGYENIGVDDIAARANIGRSTFYMHYRSKDDLLKQTMTRPSTSLAAIVGQDMAPKMLLPILDHFFDQRFRNRLFFQPPIRNIWVACLAEMIEPRVAQLARHASGPPVLSVTMISAHIAEMQVALLSRWLTSRPLLKPLAIAEALVGITRATLDALLGRRPAAGR